MCDAVRGHTAKHLISLWRVVLVFSWPFIYFPPGDGEKLSLISFVLAVCLCSLYYVALLVSINGPLGGALL